MADWMDQDRSNCESVRESFNHDLVDHLLRADRTTSARGATVFGCHVWPLLRYLYMARIEKGHTDTPPRMAADKAYLKQVLQEWRFGRSIGDVEGEEDITWPDRWLRASHRILRVYRRESWKLSLRWQYFKHRVWRSGPPPRKVSHWRLAHRDTLAPEERATISSIKRLRADKHLRRERFEAALEEQLRPFQTSGTADLLFVVRPEEHFQKFGSGSYAPIADSWMQVLSEFGEVQKISFAAHKMKLCRPAQFFDPSVGHHLFPTPRAKDGSGAHVVIFPVVEYLRLQRLRRSLAGIHPHLDFAPRPLIELVYSLRKQRAALRELIACIKPRAVFVTSFTGYPALIWACRDANIPVIDLQHGGMSSRHGIVTHYHRLPRDGYEVLPDQFWCWDQNTTDMINGWMGRGSSRHLAVAAGNAFWHLCRRSALDDELNEKEQAFLSGLPGRKVALVTLIYGKSQFLPDIVRAAIEAAGSDVFWLIRMHGLNRERGDEIDAMLPGLQDRYDWAMATQLPLPMLLDRADVHVTQFSSTWREADMLGVPTAFVDAKVRSYFPEALTLQHNALCETASELRDFVRTRQPSKIGSETAYALDHQQIRNALDRARRPDQSPPR